MTDELFRSMLKDVIKEVLSEIEDEKVVQNNKKRNLNPDLISTTEAYSLRGKARVTELVNRGLLTRISSGRAINSPKYISKSKLIELDNTYL